MSRESVDLVIEGSDFYRSIQRAPRTKLKNGWCDFRLLADQQARQIANRFVLGSILYFDPRANNRAEESYGSVQRRQLWFGRLKNLAVSELLVSQRLDYQDQVVAALAHREFSANVLVLSSEGRPCFPALSVSGIARGSPKDCSYRPTSLKREG